MAKVKINVFLEKNGHIIFDRDVNAIMLDNKIRYLDDVLNVFDISNLILKRSSSNYSIELDFVNQSGVYISSFVRVPICINVLYKSVCNNCFHIKYEQEMFDERNVFIYILKVIL
ncbi:MAG: hypothetical protein J6D28_06470 [Bacilli bacterium]|nr:hypothetical protein [Bacilli bacterium]